MKEEKIRIIDSQLYETHQDKNEAVVTAKVGERNGATAISFSQIDPGMNAVIRTFIKLKDNVITVAREGAITNKLVFDILNPYHTVYHTPYGDMDITIITKTIQTILEGEQLVMEIAYEIQVQGSKMSDNIYRIENERN